MPACLSILHVYQTPVRFEIEGAWDGGIGVDFPHPFGPALTTRAGISCLSIPGPSSPRSPSLALAMDAPLLRSPSSVAPASACRSSSASTSSCRAPGHRGVSADSTSVPTNLSVSDILLLLLRWAASAPGLPAVCDCAECGWAVPRAPSLSRVGRGRPGPVVTKCRSRGSNAPRRGALPRLAPLAVVPQPALSPPPAHRAVPGSAPPSSDLPIALGSAPLRSRFTSPCRLTACRQPPGTTPPCRRAPPPAPASS